MDGYFPQSELTAEEKQIITEYMLLPYIRRALEVDRKAIFASHLKFKNHYIEQLNDAISKVTADMSKNKKQVFDYHIRFTRRTWLEYEVYVRGRLFEVVYHKGIAVDWIRLHVKDYFPQELDVSLEPPR
ncbi:hypothetical protein NIE88_19010 [Sporolactobacillus shoreicorticis]|uniref:Uncharacterized protein n=1 Tax=Sporolactobacillus shoreicorticis TaxID=1923877 RepID=A0ABW5S6T8_9BACL|nr:hypothetical protein [Sporolactobacillus shoreicorticis]MCO7127841.1 hypothetical protein [Sporolactobacillus shoreicorticis]